MTKKIRLIALAVLLASACVQAAPLKATPHDVFETSIRSSVAPLAGTAVRDLKLAYVSADVGPWLDTGLALQAGDQVTMVVDGVVWLSRTYQLGLDQPLAAWARIGNTGPIFHGTRNTNTFTADRAGTLQLKAFPTRWRSRSGAYVPEPSAAAVNPDAGGSVSVALIRWRKGIDPAQALRTISAVGDAPNWASAELARLQHTPQVPAGWNYLWELGPAEIFQQTTADDGGPNPRMDVHTAADVAILQRPVAAALSANTTLNWRWKVDQLPAAVSENNAATHDYLSIAIEFENGRDLTYFWSRDLPPGTSFPCPLAAWTDRETHMVARSGTAELGRWLDEAHPILADYAKAIGGPPPKRIVRVWLIANSAFQRGEGRAQFGDIRFGGDKTPVAVW